jgi:selenocysteine-specific elongation factor
LAREADRKRPQTGRLQRAEGERGREGKRPPGGHAQRAEGERSLKDQRPSGGRLLGTAGHIDHGKTALVRALTGVDTDRLPEEKARGITIDLGFAPLDLPDGSRVSVVDVPGHEALVRTMVAGATGIDLLLLVVAADEGVMPQTREHLAICELLGVTRAVVALTKVDLVTPELLDLAAAEVVELLARTPLAGAEVVPVSSRTGAGIEELRLELAALAAAPPRTPRHGPPRLAVDRAFEMRGFGAVVTGTLIGGALRIGDALRVYPGDREARVRGLESHGEPADRVEPGARCAVNLQGVPLSELARGCVLAPPGRLAPATGLDVELDWLASAPEVEGPAAVTLLTGTCERRARVAPIGADRIVPGHSLFARVHVDGEPVPVLPGDRFILRGFARTPMGGATLGGGRVLDVAPPHRRRSDPALVRDLEALRLRRPEVDVAVRVRRAGLAGIARAELERETGLAATELDAALAKLTDTDAVRTTTDAICVAEPALATLEARLEGALDAYHRAEPLRPGMPTGALRGSLPDNVPPGVAALALERLAARGAAIVAGDYACRPDHRPRLDAAAAQLAERVAAILGRAGLDAPSLRDLAAAAGAAPADLRDLLAHLEREGRLVRAPGELWFDATSVEALRERLRAHFRAHAELDTRTYKALIGTSRRTAVPLMELLDTERFTSRRGDVRVLRAR